MALIVRRATAEDAAAIAAIHNAIIRHTTVTFTTAERDPAEVAARIGAGQPHLVLLGDGDGTGPAAGCVAGFATFFPFRNGPGYRYTFEHTLVLAEGARGQGGGRALMEALEAAARAEGGHSLIAGVSAENAAGVAFHAGLGFATVARLPQVGWKFGRWHDLVLMQKFLSARGGGV